MRFKSLLTILSGLFIAFNIQASNPLKEGYKIQISAPSQKGSTAHFASYWADGAYIIDSIQIPQSGEFIFEDKNTLPTGQYLIYIRPDIRFELLIDEKEQSDIRIEIDNDLNKSKIQGSADTELLWQYLSQLSDEESKNQKLANSYIDKYKHTWFSDFLKANQPVEGEPHPTPTNNEEAFENLRYLRNHFFDNINFTDERLWRTNLLVPMVNSYLTDLIPQQLDSIASRSSWIVSQTEANPFCFENMLSTLTNRATTSKVMGMENVWARLAEDYIFDKNISWIDSTQYSELKREYSLIEQNRIGMKAQNLNLITIEGDSIDTNDVEAEYLLLYFYSTSCGYCSSETDKMRDELYPRHKEHGLKVITINTESQIDHWDSYIKQHKMDEWMNTADPNFKSQYWLKYDVSGTPSIYLLDKDKIIVAKKIDIETLDTYLSRIVEAKKVQQQK